MHFTLVEDGDREARFNYITLNLRIFRGSMIKKRYFTRLDLNKRNNCKILQNLSLL